MIGLDYRRRPLFESVIDLERDGLDGAIWDPTTKLLRSNIESQICDLISNLTTIGVFVAGSIAGFNWTAGSDIDVNIVVSTSQLMAAVLAVKPIQRTMATSTNHPIEFYIIPDQIDATKYDGLYDVLGRTWISPPRRLPPHASDFLTEFDAAIHAVDLQAAQLRRDLIDFRGLQKLQQSDIDALDLAVQHKVTVINQHVTELADKYVELKQIRRSAFETELPKLLASKQLLPANVIYKLLERYYYVDLMRRLHKLCKPIRSEDDVDQVIAIVKQSMVAGF